MSNEDAIREMIQGKKHTKCRESAEIRAGV